MTFVGDGKNSCITYQTELDETQSMEDFIFLLFFAPNSVITE